jgi:hypothetical protein
MKMTDRDDMAALDKLLENAARNCDVPPALIRRVLDDAAALQPRKRQTSIFPRWRSILASLGGWPAVGGLVAATCAGFWIGVSPPVFLPDAGALVFGTAEDFSYEIVADDAGFGWVLEEG